MQPVPASEACAHALEHTKGPLDESWQMEQWSKGLVEVALLRTANPDFDGLRLTKNERMADILERSRGDVVDGTFPRSQRIKVGGAIPAVMIESDDTGELFVADGQGRVFTALWHGIERIDAYVFHRPGVRSRSASYTQRIHDRVRHQARKVRP
jgi:hypothetical protein